MQLGLSSSPLKHHSVQLLKDKTISDTVKNQNLTPCGNCSARGHLNPSFTLIPNFATKLLHQHYFVGLRPQWTPYTIAVLQDITGKKDKYFYHTMAWVGISLKHHLVPTLLPQAGTPSMRPGCSKTHPIRPWKHSQGRAPRTSPGKPFLCIINLTVKNFFFTSNVNLFQFKVITPCPKTNFSISRLVALFLLANFTETSNLVYQLY